MWFFTYRKRIIKHLEPNKALLVKENLKLEYVYIYIYIIYIYIYIFIYLCISLYIDQIIYTRHKPYQCNQCGKAFFTKFNLVYLERMHNVEPYHCYQCGKAFTNSLLSMWQGLHKRWLPYITQKET